MSGWAALAQGIGTAADKMLDIRAQKRNIRQMEKERAAQKTFAQHGIRWKVADAKAAGLHPLAALGAQTHSYSPMSVGSEPPSQMGQNLARAVRSLQTPAEKELAQLTIDQERAKLDNMNLTNVGLRHEVDQLTNPPMPSEGSPSMISGQTSSGRLPPDPGTFSAHSNVEAGVSPMEKYYVDRDNNVVLLLNEKASEAMENDPFAKTMMFGNKAVRVAKSWNYYFAPNTKAAMRWRASARQFRKSLGKPPKGYQFKWHPETGSFKIERDKGKNTFYTRGRHSHIKY